MLAIRSLARARFKRSFTTTARFAKSGDGKHTTRKDDTLDIQSDTSAKGRAAKANNQGGHATTESDTRNSTQKAKADHPEAPDVVIGMQDERGGKGL